MNKLIGIGIIISIVSIYGFFLILMQQTQETIYNDTIWNGTIYNQSCLVQPEGDKSTNHISLFYLSLQMRMGGFYHFITSLYVFHIHSFPSFSPFNG